MPIEFWFYQWKFQMDSQQWPDPVDDPPKKLLAEAFVPLDGLVVMKVAKILKGILRKAPKLMLSSPRLTINAKSSIHLCFKLWFAELWKQVWGCFSFCSTLCMLLFVFKGGKYWSLLLCTFSFSDQLTALVIGFALQILGNIWECKMLRFQFLRQLQKCPA